MHIDIIDGRLVEVFPGHPGHALIILHSLGTDGRFMRSQIPLDLLSWEHRPTLIYPHGVGKSWHAGQSILGPAARQKVDDVTHLQSVRIKHAVGMNTSYVGFSNGAYMAQTMAALTGRHAITFAGHLVREITPIGGAQCDNFIGTGDRTAPIEGRIRIGGWPRKQLPYREQARKWDRHTTYEFTGGHEIPARFEGETIEHVVLRLYREEIGRRVG